MPSTKIPFFPLWKRGMRGDLTTFQTAKLLRYFYINDFWEDVNIKDNQQSAHSS